jgi:hypothetical protein
MAQSFTRNYTDHSNGSGFQFEFFCDKCGNGHRSSFQVSKLGLAAGLLRAAGSLFGGALSSAGHGADQVKDVLRGQAWDEAFREANDEIRSKFHQCTRCGKWVCPDVCWNDERQLCEECAPDLAEQAASIQAQVAVDQTWEKARAVDQTQGLDASQPKLAKCPRCSAKLQANAKFCGACGAPVGAKAKAFCAECGGELAPGAKFCAGCGAAVAK